MLRISLVSSLMAFCLLIVPSSTQSQNYWTWSGAVVTSEPDSGKTVQGNTAAWGFYQNADAFLGYGAGYMGLYFYGDGVKAEAYARLLEVGDDPGGSWNLATNNVSATAEAWVSIDHPGLTWTNTEEYPPEAITLRTEIEYSGRVCVNTKNWVDDNILTTMLDHGIATGEASSIQWGTSVSAQGGVTNVPANAMFLHDGQTSSDGDVAVTGEPDSDYITHTYGWKDWWDADLTYQIDYSDEYAVDSSEGEVELDTPWFWAGASAHMDIWVYDTDEERCGCAVSASASGEGHLIYTLCDP
jgi:hypothetical protein